MTQQRRQQTLIKQLSKSDELVTLLLADWGEFMHIIHSTINILDFLPIFEIRVPVRPSFWKFTPRKTALRSKFYFVLSFGIIEVWQNAKNCFFIENFRKFRSIFQVVHLKWTKFSRKFNLSATRAADIILCVAQRPLRGIRLT